MALGSTSATSALALVDYANVLPGRTDELEPGHAEVLLRRIAITVAAVNGSERVHVRLYGGWMQGLEQSDAASRALIAATKADPFPFTTGGRIVHGRIELATSLLSEPTWHLPSTYRIRGSVPRLRLRDSPLPLGCVRDTATCPAVMLKRFTRKQSKLCPTDSCPVTCEDAFVHAEQKMVDTHMATDLLHAATEGVYGSVVAVTGDTDLVPPLIHSARTTATSMSMLSLVTALPSDFEESLRSFGVSILEGVSP